MPFQTVIFQSFPLLVDDATIESLSGVLVFEVSGKMVEKKLRTKAKKDQSAKQTCIASLKNELAESNKALQQIEIALNKQGRSIQDLIGDL